MSTEATTASYEPFTEQRAVTTVKGARITLDGVTHTIHFSRRRYPGCTYTWASLIEADGSYRALGDPFPCVSPKRAELIALVRAAVALD